MNSEFFAALEMLEKEKGISKQYMLEKTEAALVAAYKKAYDNMNVRVAIDEAKKDIKLYQQKTVVETVTNPITEISLEDAKEISKRYAVGKVVETEIKTKNLSRIAAGAAKSVIIQGIREAERNAKREAYELIREEIITAVVLKVDAESGDALIETDTSKAVLKKAEQIPGEVLRVGDRIKVYISEVNREERGPLVILSRKDPGLVRRMFELEVPEIKDGIVIIKGISREAGSRTKIAVYSRNDDVDAVGACIGNRGSRIAAVLDELAGEKIDVIPYSESVEEFVKAALAPANIISVTVENEKVCKATVSPDQLSLTIGKEGQNARLAARLTGCKIDIKAE